MIVQNDRNLSAPSTLAHWRKHAPVVLPSLLLCDFGNLAAEVEKLHAAGVQSYHLDVMDGEFVPNITYGMPIVAAMRKLTDMPLDAHLMIANPAKYIDQFIAAGADSITFHIEAVEDPRPILARIKQLGAVAGVALNPGTPLERITGCLDLCDMVLVMSVDAGFGGQKFNPVALEKLRALRQMAPGLILEVDGGVSPGTIASCAAAGAELFVVGSAIFGHPDYGGAISRLTDLACSHKG